MSLRQTTAILSFTGVLLSLARPGRTRATATKLYLLQATQKKKNSEGRPSNHVSAPAMTSVSDEKWRPFNCFFSRVGLRTYQNPYISVASVYYRQPNSQDCAHAKCQCAWLRFTCTCNSTQHLLKLLCLCLSVCLHITMIPTEYIFIHPFIWAVGGWIAM
jgi:hypothetical protein